MDRSRRSALKVAGITVCGLPGCTSAPAETDGTTNETSSSTADRTPSETPTATPTIDEQLQNLTFEAEMLAQQSADSPARFEARLINTGSENVRFGMGPTLLFSDTGPDENPKRADDLIIDPDTFIGPWSDPIKTADDCWRFPEDGGQAVQSMLRVETMEPAETITEQYSVYTDAAVSACLPAGRYTFQDVGDIYIWLSRIWNPTGRSY